MTQPKKELMAISKTTLAAIQKTGTFATNLKLALQAETKKYSDRLSKALASSAHGNALELLDGAEITTWKSVGKLAKMVDAIEAELSSALKFASDLATGTPQAVTATAAVTAAKGPKVAATQFKTPTTKKAAPKALTKAPAGRGGANAEKLLAQLAPTLSSEAFTVLKQTALSKTTGIPLGSMTAALKKLTESGDLVLGKDGGYKLGKKKTATVSKAAVAAVKPAKTATKSAAKSPAPKATAVVPPDTAAPKAPAKKAVLVAKNVATKVAAPKAAAVASKPKQAKPVVTPAKPVAKAAAKKAPAKKASVAAKAAEAAASKTDATKSEPVADTAVQDTAVVAAS